MHCYNKLNFNFEDIAKVEKQDLIDKIMEQYYNKAVEPYNAYMITHEILDYKFTQFLKHRHLTLMPHGFVFICRPFTKGLTHTDYISNTVLYDPILKGFPEYSKLLTYQHIDLHNRRNKSKNYHVSLHVDLTNSGTLDWFKENASTNFYISEEGKVPFWVYQGDQLLTLCDQLSNGGVAILRTDVLHMSNNEFSDRPRIAVTFRFAGNPTFEQLKAKLHDFVIERE